VERNKNKEETPTGIAEGQEDLSEVSEDAAAIPEEEDVPEYLEPQTPRHFIPDRLDRRTSRPGDAISCQPLEVKVFEGKMDKAIRMLKNRLAKEGVLKEIKRRRHYSKPSEQKRIKARDAARRRRKATKIRRGP